MRIIDQINNMVKTAGWLDSISRFMATDDRSKNPVPKTPEGKAFDSYMKRYGGGGPIDYFKKYDDPVYSKQEDARLAQENREFKQRWWAAETRKYKQRRLAMGRQSVNLGVPIQNGGQPVRQEDPLLRNRQLAADQNARFRGVSHKPGDSLARISARIDGPRPQFADMPSSRIMNEANAGIRPQMQAFRNEVFEALKPLKNMQRTRQLADFAKRVRGQYEQARDANPQQRAAFLTSLRNQIASFQRGGAAQNVAKAAPRAQVAPRTGVAPRAKPST